MTFPGTDATAPFCRVAVPRPVLQTFVYQVPPELRSEAVPGSRVLVPFGRRRIVGLVMERTGSAGRSGVKPLLDALDPEPLLPPHLVRLVAWVADYYAAPPGLVVRAALPPGLLGESGIEVHLGAEPPAARPGNGSPGARIVDRLTRASGPLRLSTLRRDTGVQTLRPVLDELEAAGWIRREERPARTGPKERRGQVIRLARSLPTLMARREAFGRAERQREAYERLEELGGEAVVAELVAEAGFSRSVLSGLVKRQLAVISEEILERDPFAGDATEPPPPEPSPAQRAVLDELEALARAVRPGVALLRGVTGSGKTLVYLRLIGSVLEAGRSAVVLVPEISLTPQTVRRFRGAFGAEVAVLHSGLSEGERWDAWRAIRDGRRRVVVGTRSAIFAPTRRTGLIVLDEEHDSSYKQSDTPRYHARSLAAVRGRLEGCLCLLGSATPSLESWHNAREGRWRLLELPERATAHQLPEVRLLDLREARGAPGAPRGASEAGVTGAAGDGATAAGRRREGDSGAGAPEGAAGPPILAAELATAIAARLERSEQALLLLNRRGYSSFLQCPDCGHTWSCPGCNVSLTWHRRRGRLLCHHCGFERAPPDRCEECGAAELLYRGLGTEQVERHLAERFPKARIARMDVDTTAGKWSHDRILGAVRRREIDILLGTQMIAKGLDLPGVTLVGVINADVGLNLPDFRASERTFQLLTQVAGRAGRGEVAGEVLVQTSRPGHFALAAAARHDYGAFAERELEERAGPGYPPHRRLANLVVSGPAEESVADAASRLAEALRRRQSRPETSDLEVVGPAPCPIDRLRGRWRWHFLLRAERPEVLGRSLRRLAHAEERPGPELRLEIDRDPESLL